eukprot:13567888-Ditylum_brightwellii.AAC.1
MEARAAISRHFHALSQGIDIYCLINVLEDVILQHTYKENVLESTYFKKNIKWSFSCDDAAQ